MSKADEKKYSSYEALKRSDEYQAAGVLGRERLREKHFPETNKPSNAAGERKLTSTEELAKREDTGPTGV